jgi:hypothetical protein
MPATRCAPLATHDLAAELGRLWRLSREAFRDNLLDAPIGDAEFHGI